MAGISRWDPFQQLAQMQRDFDRVFGRVSSPATSDDPGGWMPSVDVEQTREALVFKFDLPDVTADDVAIELHGRTLTVGGERRGDREPGHEGYLSRERRMGPFSRTFMLPDNLDEDAVSAAFEAGVLRVRVRRPREATPRRIPISGAPEASQGPASTGGGEPGGVSTAG